MSLSFGKCWSCNDDAIIYSRYHDEFCCRNHYIPEERINKDVFSMLVDRAAYAEAQVIELESELAKLRGEI